MYSRKITKRVQTRYPVKHSLLLFFCYAVGAFVSSKNGFMPSMDAEKYLAFSCVILALTVLSDNSCMGVVYAPLMALAFGFLNARQPVQSPKHFVTALIVMPMFFAVETKNISASLKLNRAVVHSNEALELYPAFDLAVLFVSVLTAIYIYTQ